MKQFLLLVLCIAMTFIAKTQFIYHPLPFKGSDFKIFDTKKIAKCFVYQATGDTKVLVKEFEFGAKGYLAASYDKGTDDNGDSINTSETSYKYDAKGRLLQVEEEDAEYGNSRTLYTYDATGKLVKKETATIDPPTYRYKYDTKGRLVSVNVTQRWPETDEEGNSTGRSMEKPASRSTFTYKAKCFTCL